MMPSPFVSVHRFTGSGFEVIVYYSIYFKISDIDVSV